jgi:hypothetical protein
MRHWNLVNAGSTHCTYRERKLSDDAVDRRKKDKGPSKYGNIEATKEVPRPMIGPDRDNKLLEAATALIGKEVCR